MRNDDENNPSYIQHKLYRTRPYFAITGKTCLAFEAAASAIFWSCCDLTLRRYRNKRIKTSSILDVSGQLVQVLK